jgi:hypothetical protein
MQALALINTGLRLGQPFQAKRVAVDKIELILPFLWVSTGVSIVSTIAAKLPSMCPSTHSEC